MCFFQGYSNDDEVCGVSANGDPFASSRFGRVLAQPSKVRTDPLRSVGFEGKKLPSLVLRIARVMKVLIPSLPKIVEKVEVLLLDDPIHPNVLGFGCSFDRRDHPIR